MDTLEFTVPPTPQNVAAMEELKRQLFNDACTLYGVDENGNTIPVATVTKHPECPDGWYEAVMKAFVNLNPEVE